MTTSPISTNNFSSFLPTGGSYPSLDQLNYERFEEEHSMVFHGECNGGEVYSYYHPIEKTFQNLSCHVCTNASLKPRLDLLDVWQKLSSLPQKILSFGAGWAGQEFCMANTLQGEHEWILVDPLYKDAKKRSKIEKALEKYHGPSPSSWTLLERPEEIERLEGISHMLLVDPYILPMPCTASTPPNCLVIHDTFAPAKSHPNKKAQVLAEAHKTHGYITCHQGFFQVIARDNESKKRLLNCIENHLSIRGFSSSLSSDLIERISELFPGKTVTPRHSMIQSFRDWAYKVRQANPHQELKVHELWADTLFQESPPFTLYETLLQLAWIAPPKTSGEELYTVAQRVLKNRVPFLENRVTYTTPQRHRSFLSSPAPAA